MALTFNDRQTQIPQEVFDALPKDTIERFMDIIEGVPFIRWMVSPDRPRAKDLPRDDKGRIVVDVTKPHILEDMDYFRPMAIAYEKSSDDDDKKCYTPLKPNGNPNSEYMKLWNREIDRIWNGMVRESDGEWIPGILYFYWNYTRIMFTNIIDGTEKGDRVESFPEPWDSTYLWAHYIYQAQYGGMFNGFKGGEHFGVIARRGIGKSYFLASIATRTFMCGENSRVRSKAKVFFFAYDKQYIDTGKDGTLGKFVDMFEFLARKTQFPHLLLQAQDVTMHWTLGYETRDGRRHGLLNEITGVSIKDKPGKVRGKRGVYTFYEEFGSFPGFLETFNTSRYNAEEGSISFGTIGAIGTGGSKGNDFSGALRMIYHPRGYKMHSLPNVFDKSKGKLGESILFLGAYLNRKTCYDKDGNSDVVKAVLEVLARQHVIRVSSSDPGTLAQAKAEDPLTIEDAIMKTERNIYPVADLNARIQEIRSEPHCLDDIYIGRLNIVGGKVEFQKTDDTPIRDFPLGDNKAEGALEIYSMPEIDPKTGAPIPGRYLLGADVFDNDVADSLSLGSVFVLDAFTDRLVAEFTGRPQYAKDFYEICRRLCLFYNGKLCYENNFKGLYAYFSTYSSTHLLTPVFQYLKDEDRFKGETFGNTSYGVRATTPIRNYSRGLIREWLIKPRQRTVKVDGVDVEETYPQLMDIRNVALLKELATYDTDGNFDRHDALAMLMLYREDVYRLNEGDPEHGARKPSGKYDDDVFFNEYEKMMGRRGKAQDSHYTMLM